MTPGGAPLSQPSTSASTTGTVASGVPELPDYSQVDDLIAQINAANQAAQHQANLGRIPGAEALEAQSSQNIADLLNPPSQFGEIDVPAASAAVTSGTVGSPFAGITGLNLSETERIRRQALGQQQLTGAYARNPAAPIANPEALLTLLQQQAFAGQQNEAQRTLQRYLASVEQQTALAVASLRNAYGGATGGGGGRGPSLPTDYRRPTGAPPSYRTNIPGVPPSASGAGTGEAFGIPTSAVPENFGDLTFEQRAEYAAAINANPYYGLPDYENPYE